MPLIMPFRALRPAAGRAGDVLAPPYDVMNSEEARDMAKGRPWSFLHISKPEIDLAPGTDVYADEVYAKGAENLTKMINEGVLIRDEQPCYYVYRLTWQGRQQTGLAAVGSVAAYDENRIRKHEFTKPAKEDDRVRQIDALSAQTGPVMTAYPGGGEIDALIKSGISGEPQVDHTADDGVRHEMWVMRDQETIDKLTAAFDALPAIYIADGHHRSAAASRVAAGRRAGADPQAAHEYFLTVLFPHTEMTILDYNRVIADLNGHEPDQLLEKIAATFEVTFSEDPVRPGKAGEFGMYLPGRWYQLALPAEKIPQSDPIGRLPVSLLTDNLIEPILGITDQRRDPRIDFVGGARGLEGLMARVDSGEMAVAFALYPTQMEDLMAVAEAGKVMPPKSTWFEPKLADGMTSHVLD